MTRLLTIITIILLHATGLRAEAVKGHPFTKLFTPDDYGAHIQSFDIVCDRKGNVYVANFEGLLVYDHAKWQLFHANNFMRLVSLKLLPNDNVVAYDFQKKPYIFADGKMKPYTGKVDKTFHETTDRAYDNKGGLWTIDPEGIRYTTYKTAYTRFGEPDGIDGEVISLLICNNTLYAGTDKGLFRAVRGSDTERKLLHDEVNTQFVPVAGINVACWQMTDLGNGSFLAATSKGVFIVSGSNARRITDTNTLAVTPDGERGFYAGELEGVRHYLSYDKASGGALHPIRYPSQIVIAKDKCVWVSSIYGQVWCKAPFSDNYEPMAGDPKAPIKSISALTIEDGEIYLDGPDSTFVWDRKELRLRSQTLIEGDPEHYFAHFAYTSPDGITWGSRENGKGLYSCRGRQEVKAMDQYTYPFIGYNIRAMAMNEEYIAVGGAFGLYCTDRSQVHERKNKPRLFFREWNQTNDDLDFSFSTDRESMPGKTVYAYCIDNEGWTAMSPKNVISLQNLRYGPHKLQIQCMDMYEMSSDIIVRNFRIPAPYYLQWYAFIVYLIVISAIITLIIQIRTYRIKKDKAKLEKLVNERTAQLKEAQHQLVRQEKVAMMGKLINGLIDRILNPMNYILNFTKLTQGLNNDLQQDIEDEKDNMEQDNYEDSVDLLHMIDDNLVKIEEHSSSTTRILKAMEALLHEHKQNKQKQDIASLVRKCHELTTNYYAADISRLGIKVNLDIAADKAEMVVDGEQISRSIMSVIANSMYAIAKKYEKQAFLPTLDIRLTATEQHLIIYIRDNGIGIEDSIKDKIFDPFFTTKPTAEAPGVGLYITREVIQSHGGEITINSEKDQFTETTITLKQ